MMHLYLKALLGGKLTFMDRWLVDEVPLSQKWLAQHQQYARKDTQHVIHYDEPIQAEQVTEGGLGHGRLKPEPSDGSPDGAESPGPSKHVC